MSLALLLEMATIETTTTELALRTFLSKEACRWHPECHEGWMSRQVILLEQGGLWPVLTRYPENTQQLWDEIRQGVIRGETEGLDTIRTVLEALLNKRTHNVFLGIQALGTASCCAEKLSDQASVAQDFHAKLKALEEPLKKSIQDLGKLQEDILAGWTTFEGLQERLVEDFPLSDATLKELVPRLPPPQSWYDEDGDY